MNSIKRLLCALVGAAMCTSFGACALEGDGYKNTVAGDDAVPVAAQAVQLCVFTLFEEKEYKALVDEFVQQNPGVMMEDRSEAYTESTAKDLAKMLSGDNPPDVVFFHTVEAAASFIADGLFVPIEEIRKEYPDYAKDILPVAVKSAAGGGTAYAVPVRGFYEGLFINTDLFEQYNLTPPDSWDALLEAVDVFSEAGILPIAASLTQTPHYLIDHLILTEGGTADFAKVPASAEDVPETWYGIEERLRTLYEYGAFGDEADTLSDAKATELFLNKQAAMRLDGSWLAAYLEDEGKSADVAVIAFPGTPNGELVGGFTSGFYITRSAWDDPLKREAAVSFVNAMTKDSSVHRLCSPHDLPAVALKVQDNSALLKSAYELCSGTSSLILPLDARMPHDVWTTITQRALSIAQAKMQARDAFTAAFS